MRRVASQKAAKEARRAIRFCYLCGKNLPVRLKGATTGEHVIPKALLGPLPKDPKQRWTIELTVHRECDAHIKQRSDHALKLLQTMHTLPASSWPKPGLLRSLNLNPKELTLPNGSTVPAFGNLAPVIAGVRIWVRGLHTALYGKYCPERDRDLVIPPVPAAGKEGSTITLDIVEKWSWITRNALRIGLEKRTLDEVSAWGRALEYRSAWWCSDRKKWVCFWGLNYPGVLDWSRAVLPPAHARPWHGWYIRDTVPEEASIIESADFPQR